jgi:Predicted nucleic acid-binding protein, contains PIN domain
MARYFVDTWFFIAFLDRSDADFDVARRIARRLHDAQFFTHDGVLIELLTYFSAFGEFWRREAAALVRDVLYSRRYQVSQLSRQVFEDALYLYERRLDKAYSLVDCISMRTMLRRELTHVLTNDHHFQQEGFTLVNE